MKSSDGMRWYTHPEQKAKDRLDGNDERVKDDYWRGKRSTYVDERDDGRSFPGPWMASESELCQTIATR